MPARRRSAHSARTWPGAAPAVRGGPAADSRCTHSHWHAAGQRVTVCPVRRSRPRQHRPAAQPEVLLPAVRRPRRSRSMSRKRSRTSGSRGRRSVCCVAPRLLRAPRGVLAAERPAHALVRLLWLRAPCAKGVSLARAWACGLRLDAVRARIGQAAKPRAGSRRARCCSASNLIDSCGSPPTEPGARARTRADELSPGQVPVGDGCADGTLLFIPSPPLKSR